MKAKIPYRLTLAEKKAMDEEINRQILESDKRYSVESDAMVLWVMHVVFGFGKKRLRRYWEACFREHRNLREYFEFSEDDMGWLYSRKLKEIGVDIEAWYAEQPPTSKDE